MEDRPALNPETAALLLEFLGNGGRFDGDPEEAGKQQGYDEGQACVAYRGEDVAAITATMKRLATQHEERELRHTLALSTRVLLQLLPSLPGPPALTTLTQDGVLRLNNICTSELCDRLLESINDSLALELASKNPEKVETGFGNVLARDNRWDMYLPPTGCYLEALESMFGIKESPLSVLFNDVFGGQDAELHELSSLICDCGALSQPIHPDSQHDSSSMGFSKLGPMYTIFLALQDVEEDMGPTVFLPRTNTQTCHESFKGSTDTKADFLAGCEYRQSLLRKGDVAVMDSRTLHMGHENVSSRRVLFYFTLRSPSLFASSSPPIPRGSMIAGISPRMLDFRLPLKA